MATLFPVTSILQPVGSSFILEHTQMYISLPLYIYIRNRSKVPCHVVDEGLLYLLSEGLRTVFLKLFFFFWFVHAEH